ncbi:hypothetical protein [Halobacillus sp. Marseille-Q1614]|nr:hypothetical protein [Halobacillus sp. Marseille-Q1614]
MEACKLYEDLKKDFEIKMGRELKEEEEQLIHWMVEQYLLENKKNHLNN